VAGLEVLPWNLTYSARCAPRAQRVCFQTALTIDQRFNFFVQIYWK